MEKVDESGPVTGENLGTCGGRRLPSLEGVLNHKFSLDVKEGVRKMLASAILLCESQTELFAVTRRSAIVEPMK